jgi:hypothetical protein
VLVSPLAALKQLYFDFGNTARVKTEAFGGANGDIDDATSDVGAAVSDRQNFRFAIKQAGDPNFASHGPMFVGGSVGVIVEASTTGGLCAEVGAGAIPRGEAMLGSQHR